MPETQIKIEIASFKRLFPLFAKLTAKRLGVKINHIKKFKNYYLLSLSNNTPETYHFIENFYNFGNFFNIQKVIFEYK